MFVIKKNGVEVARHDTYTSVYDNTIRYILRESFCLTDTCISCPAGSYLHPSTLTCTQCEAGKYNNVEGNKLSECSQCPRGKYSESSGANDLSTCLQCPSGKASNILAAPSSSDCLVCTGMGETPDPTNSDCIKTVTVDTFTDYRNTVDVSYCGSYGCPPAGSLVTLQMGRYAGRVTTSTSSRVWFAKIAGESPGGMVSMNES